MSIEKQWARLLAINIIQLNVIVSPGDSGPELEIIAESRVWKNANCEMNTRSWSSNFSGASWWKCSIWNVSKDFYWDDFFIGMQFCSSKWFRLNRRLNRRPSHRSSYSTPESIFEWKKSRWIKLSNEFSFSYEYLSNNIKCM